MQNIISLPNANTLITQRVKELFHKYKQDTYKHTDRMFAILMVVQWFAGIAAAVWISPRTWIGAESQIHLHVWASVFLGSVITFFPVALALTRPGETSTRYVIAIGQMLMGALLIHLSGGRIETHFHVFGSLAFLAFYRDWRVLIPATLVVSADHFLRGMFFPQSIFGVLAATNWRWLEHAGWVVFIDVFLVISCVRGAREMKETAERTTDLEIGEERFRDLFDNANDIIYTRDLEGNITSLNKTGEKITGYTQEEAVGMNIADLVAPEYVEAVRQMLARHVDEQTPTSYEFEILTKTGERVALEVSTRMTYENGAPSGAQGIARDITGRKEAEIQLKNSDEFNRSIFENSPDCVKVLELDGTLHSMNANGLCIMEIDDFKPFVGEVWVDFWQGEENKAARKAVEDARNGKSVSFEGFCKTAKGTMKYWDVSVAPILDATGKPCRLISTSRDITERRRAGEALHESEFKLRTLLANMSEGLLQVDAEDSVVFVNNRFCEMVGYSEEQLIGENWSQLLLDEEGREFIREVNKRRREGISDRYELRLKKKSAETLYVLVGGVSILEAEGVVSGSMGVFTDITERKRAEAERQAITEIAQSVISTSNLDELFKLAHQSIGKILPAKNCFIALHDSDTDLIHFEYWVDEVDDMPLPRPIGKGFTSYILRTGEPLLLTEEIGKRMIEQGEVEQSGSASSSWMGVPLRTRSRAFGVLAVQYHKKNNAYTRRDLELLASVGDQLALAIERKQNEIELQTREAQLNEAQTIAHLGNWEWDIKTNKVSWSDEEYRIFGLEPQEFSATYETYLERVHPDDRQMVTEIIGKALEEKVYQNFEHRIVRPDGEVRTIHADGKIILDESGNPIKTLGITLDITEQKQFEAELEQTRDAALESARLKSEFLANMSHEIRTPMNGVIGMTGLLLDTGLDEEQREFTETVRSSAESLLTIINDILDFSKIEAGKLSFERLDFDLRSVVESSVELLAERAQSKKIELLSLVDSDVPTLVSGDAGRIKQVLLNLTGNAVKFTERGEVAVSVKKQDETETSVTVRFAITDTGIGISEEEQRRLFQAFVQADGSTTRKYGGTGLGLAISKQIVEMMGGEIGIESAPGKGSTFWFVVKLEKQSAEAIAATPLAPRADLHDLRVLVVDDNATNRKILVHQTASWGMIPVEAESGAAALRLLGASIQNGGEPFDVALLDLMMPGMDGFELAQAVKQDSQLSNVKLVLMPSFGQRGDGQAAREIGIAAYLMKPVRQSQLFDCLAEVMSEAGAGAAADVSTAASTEMAASRLVTRHSLEENKFAADATRILIAEDNPVNQKVSRRQVENLGYRADVVENGVEALDALSKIRYDIVLMDCQMPLMDGYEATAAIRRREEIEENKEGETGRRTVVIAMTANALEGEMEKCLAAGMDDYISKPVNVEELQRVLKRWQPNSSGGRTAVKTDRLSLASPNNVAPPVDMTRLLEAVDDDAELARELVEIYLKQMTEVIEKMDVAIASGDADEINRLAHTATGSSGTIGVTALVAQLKELERTGANGKLENAPPLIAQVKEEMIRVELFFKESPPKTTRV